jgi:D-psicose/D-tagatose/L-ribulose 3-epimerase
MRFGICAPWEQGQVAANAGYDYIEPALAPTLQPGSPEAEVMPALIASLTNAPLVPEAWNVFLPGELKVTGEKADSEAQERYLESAFARTAMMGGKIVVFGSGGARGIPTGFSTQTAQRQLEEFLGRAGDAAERHGVKVAIEPLNAGECNVINSVSEALTLARTVGHPSVGVLSDLYHVAVEGQSYEETRLAGSLLWHVHVAGGVGRRAPNREDAALLTGYFRVLKESGYEGRISVEGQWQDLAAQAEETHDVMQNAWEAA